MKILIIHGYSPANIGDGAIVLAMISEARRVFGEATQIRVSATDPRAFDEYLGVQAHSRLLPWYSMGTYLGRLRWLLANLLPIALLWWASGQDRRALRRVARSRLLPAATREAVAAYLESDLVVAAGGGYLGDSYRRQLPFWHLEYRCATAAGIPLVFFSQSVGQTRRRVTRIFLRKMLDRSALFIARDPHSVEHLTALGPYAGRVELCPDVATLLKPSSTQHPPSDEGEHYLGVSLLRWRNFEGDEEDAHQAYLSAMEEGLVALLKREPGLRIRMFATNAAIGANPMDDVGVVADFCHRLAADGFADRCEIVEWTPLPEVFMEMASTCELFVATRMHSAILALDAGVPVAGVAYEEKMRGLLGAYGLDEYVADIEQPERIPAVVLAAYERRKELRRRVADVTPEVRARAARAMDLVAEVVEGCRA